MRVFVTGASGFVGFAVVQELLQAGHTVLGLARSDDAAARLIKAGATVHRGDIYDLESIKSGATLCDAVIHTAFNHDFSKYKENCETDRQVVLALGEALANTDKPVVITSGIGLMNPGRIIVETDMPASSETTPRAASEEAANAIAAKGVKAYILRLPPTTHGEGDHGFVPMLAELGKQKGVSAYVGEGKNHWSAVHRFDAAVLYRLIIEQKPALKVFHAVAEQGVEFIDIATAIGNGFHLPVVSKEGEEAQNHFGWFRHFAGIDCEASSGLSRKSVGWEPVHPTLMEDLNEDFYWK